MEKFLSLLLALSLILSHGVLYAQISPSGVIRGGATRITLLASAARTADGNSATSRMQNFRQGIIQLDITAAATEVADTLNVYVQSSPDGTNWCDLISFTQATGTGGAVRRVARWNSYAAVTTAEGACTDATLAAGSVSQGPIADQIRVKWDITDSTITGNLSFTFSVIGYFRE